MLKGVLQEKKIKLHGSETQIYTKKWRTSEKE